MRCQDVEEYTPFYFTLKDSIDTFYQIEQMMSPEIALLIAEKKQVV